MRWMPSEAMSFNGKVIENEIRGYQTLFVSGREIARKSLLKQDIDGRDGVMVLAEKLSPRSIFVKYILEGDSAGAFRNKYNKLNILLQGNDVPITFADEPSHTFYGTVEDAEKVANGALVAISSFSIFCADPFKYGIDTSISGTGQVTIKKELPYEVLPTEIIITPLERVSKITVKNNKTGMQIVVENTFDGNTPLYIRNKIGEIVYKGIKRPDIMHWSSDFEDFLLHNDDVVSVIPATAKITVRVGDKLL